MGQGWGRAGARGDTRGRPAAANVIQGKEITLTTKVSIVEYKNKHLMFNFIRYLITLVTNKNVLAKTILQMIHSTRQSKTLKDFECEHQSQNKWSRKQNALNARVSAQSNAPDTNSKLA
ncbi:unnamed protein product, partial [Brenthis ino]